MKNLTLRIVLLATMAVAAVAALRATPMIGLAVMAAVNLTPMIDAPATAPLANLGFACSSHVSIPFKKHSCSVNNEWNVRRKTILRSGSESNTARSFSNRLTEDETVMDWSFFSFSQDWHFVMAAGNSTPMIDAPATAPLADGCFAASSHASIVFSDNYNSKENGFPANLNLEDISCSVNAECVARSALIQRSGSESQTARSFSIRRSEVESRTARSSSSILNLLCA